MRTLLATLAAAAVFYAGTYATACDITGGFRCFPIVSSLAECRAAAASALEQAKERP